ncbi:hypothetical protein [Methyloversatilis sp. XJ19-49]|uniref:hypothetical protein n=1 Tax=Methyloversatilis sp. XJ19-49 TaxID=2963429 RepID=UPI00211B9989|nr:hypothetical protein [Methyloversatilis sp. XJ19-49]MCQ9379311.1 hypothetical protein [Methyloversatilis sp. XJ19-49]
MKHDADDGLEGLRRAVAARSLGIEGDAGLTDALLERYRRALGRRVADALRRRFPCSAAMLGRRCFHTLVQRLVVERREVISLRQAEQIVSGGWLGQQQELQAVPWLGELVRMESEIAELMAAPLARRALPMNVRHFRSDWDVVRIYEWWRSGARGKVQSPGARVAAIIVGRPGRVCIVRLPCIQPLRDAATHACLAVTPPGG